MIWQEARLPPGSRRRPKLISIAFPFPPIMIRSQSRAPPADEEDDLGEDLLESVVVYPDHRDYVYVVVPCSEALCASLLHSSAPSIACFQGSLVGAVRVQPVSRSGDCVYRRASCEFNVETKTNLFDEAVSRALAQEKRLFPHKLLDAGSSAASKANAPLYHYF